MTPDKRVEFQQELTSLINRFSAENDSNTPDFILANYLMACFHAFSNATSERRKWYGLPDEWAAKNESP